MRKVLSVVGTRPEAIKMAPVLQALASEPWVDSLVALTAQHRDLLDRALANFEIVADFDLDLMRPNQSLGELTSRAFAALEPILKEVKPDLVLAQGDTTTVMVTAMSCFYLGIPFGHVEAGLRTGDIRNPFPEEANRVFVGPIASLHFAPTRKAADALLAEGISEDRVLVAGNTVIDALIYTRVRGEKLSIDLPPNSRLMLMTSHRRENFGEPMEEAFGAVRALVDAREDLHVLFPVHPNPNVTSLADRFFADHPRIHLRAPLDYAEFCAAMEAADVILTDSGGVQEEAPALGKPVLVMRRETERPEAVSFGVVKLVGCDREQIISSVGDLLDDPDAYAAMARGVSPYGDGYAARRIVQRIRDFLGESGDEERLGPFDPEQPAGGR